MKTPPPDPARLTSDSSEASQDLRLGLRQMGDYQVPEDRFAAVGERLAPLWSSPPNHPARSGAGKRWVGAAVATGVVAGAIGALLHMGQRPMVSSPPAHPAAELESPPAGPLAGSPATPLQAFPSQGGAADSRKGHPSSRSAGPGELVLLQQARAELGSRPEHALILTTQHATHFPTGFLAQERELIAIEALLRLGRTDEARRRADRFRAAFPGSAHAARLDDLLGPSRR